MEAHLYIAQVREALAGGGFFGALVPTTNQVLPADSLKRLQGHYHALEQLLTMKQVLKIRDANWCDEEGNPVDMGGEELEKLRLTTE